MGDGQPSTTTDEKCYFCRSTNIEHVNRKCMNGEIGTFRKCRDCHAGEAMPYDENAMMEEEVKN